MSRFLPTLFKLLCFMLAGIILQVLALFYYGSMVTDPKTIFEFLLESTPSENLTTILYGVSNGTIFFIIYMLIAIIVKKIIKHNTQPTT